jgi:ABC-2 type transport system permease protein
MSDTPNPLLELTKARLREFLREPGYVFWVFGFPLLMAVGLGLAFRERTPEPPRVAVVGILDDRYERILLESSRVRAELMSAENARRALGRSKVDLVVRGESRPELDFDATQDRALLARSIVEDVLQEGAGRSDPLELREHAVREPGSRYVDFLVPGLIGLNLMGSSMWGIGFNLVLARKRRLLRRYAVTPMRRSHFLLAYFFSRSAFLVLELALLIAFGRLAFGTMIQGSLGAVIVTSCVGAAAFAGISLLIGARLDNTEVANGWMNFVQLPMWILSGSFFSYERFPDWLQAPIRCLPLTAVTDALRAVYNDGASLFDCAFELTVLGAWTAIAFGVAVRTFRWQ